MEFQAVWDFADDDPVGGGIAATFSMYLHRRSWSISSDLLHLFLCFFFFFIKILSSTTAEFQVVWDFADDDPVGGGVAATFSMYLHCRSWSISSDLLHF
ncbi:hypothetical protein RHGRI_026551 [Rhododendron griersonianum]|uniref:Uncharacterized protein n=1 Tax=Rhododendron griersonianum TaxID=479676 RepID=A0AAV6IWR5_9ERIC|nr:hypothetical protein RHGRI_026551 [Rhododendron griersonianum]